MRGWAYWVTVVLMLGVVVGLVGWDVYVASNKVDGDTISEIIQGLAFKHTVPATAWGVIAGHFFWPGSNMFSHWWGSVIVLALVTVLLCVLDIVHVKVGLPLVALLESEPIIMVFFGIILGHIVWPLAR